MSLFINPCKACWSRYKDKGCNINTLNNCVTETAAAFANVPTNNIVNGTPAGSNWYQCMNKAMAEQGRDFQNFQLNMAPVFFQTPHHYPQLLRETGDPRLSLDKCKQMCYGLNKNTCIDNCETDHLAVEEHKDRLPKFNGPNGGLPEALPSIWGDEEYRPYQENYKHVQSQTPKKLNKSVAFWIGLIISSIVFAFCLAIIIKMMFVNN